MNLNDTDKRRQLARLEKHISISFLFHFFFSISFLFLMPSLVVVPIEVTMSYRSNIRLQRWYIFHGDAMPMVFFLQ